jgi:hypothetical protein
MAGRLTPPPPSYFHSFPPLPTSTWAQIARNPQPRLAAPASNASGAAAALAAGAAVDLAARAGPRTLHRPRRARIQGTRLPDLRTRLRPGLDFMSCLRPGWTSRRIGGRPGRGHRSRLRLGCRRRHCSWPRHASGPSLPVRGSPYGLGDSAQGASPWPSRRTEWHGPLPRTTSAARDASSGLHPHRRSRHCSCCGCGRPGSRALGRPRLGARARRGQRLGLPDRRSRAVPQPPGLA